MAHGELTMTREEMVAGFAKGRTLTQEEWAHPMEKQWISELIAEGKAIATPWRYSNNYQCEFRKVTGVRSDGETDT